MTEAEKVAASLSVAGRRNLLALPTCEDIWATVSEMRADGATGSGLDILYVYYRRYKLCDRRWAKWGSEPGQRRGEGYEYSILSAGLAVRDILRAKEADRG